MSIYPNLNAEVYRLNLSYPKLADALDMNLNTLYSKVKGLREFKLDEVEEIQHFLKERGKERGLDIDVSQEYLFKKVSEKK